MRPPHERIHSPGALSFTVSLPLHLDDYALPPLLDINTIIDYYYYGGLFVSRARREPRSRTLRDRICAIVCSLTMK